MKGATPNTMSGSSSITTTTKNQCRCQGAQFPRYNPQLLTPQQTKAPIPTLASNRPTRKTRAPIRADDERYNVSSYNHRPKASTTPSDAPPLTADQGEHAHATRFAPDSDPLTYEEAMSCPDAAQWVAACEEELQTFKRM